MWLAVAADDSSCPVLAKRLQYQHNASTHAYHRSYTRRPGRGPGRVGCTRFFGGSLAARAPACGVNRVGAAAECSRPARARSVSKAKHANQVAGKGYPPLSRPRTAMTLVVDASLLVAALVDDGADGRWAESELVGDYLAAPHLVYVEVANILRRAVHDQHGSAKPRR